MSGSGERPSRMSGSGRDALPDVWEWSGCPPGCPGVVEMPLRMSGMARRPSRMSESGLEAVPDVQKWT